MDKMTRLLLIRWSYVVFSIIAVHVMIVYDCFPGELSQSVQFSCVELIYLVPVILLYVKVK